MFLHTVLVQYPHVPSRSSGEARGEHLWRAFDLESAEAIKLMGFVSPAALGSVTIDRVFLSLLAPFLER